jgi:hypothetical protein
VETWELALGQPALDQLNRIMESEGITRNELVTRALSLYVYFAENPREWPATVRRGNRFARLNVPWGERPREEPWWRRWWQR